MKNIIKKIEYYFEAFTFMVLMPISLASPLFLLIWFFLLLQLKPRPHSRRVGLFLHNRITKLDDSFYMFKISY